MPFGVYTNFNCTKLHTTKFTPQKHQQFVKDYFINSPYKGLLLYHRLGSGKTCSSIIVADALLGLERIENVYIFSPGSLRQGWINEYCGICGENNELLKRYTFVTFNYNVANKLADTLDNSLIVIDEVHNLINGIKNESKTAIAIYRKIMSAKDSKILALSGTPIYNNVFEWGILGNMLKPNAFPRNPQLFMDQFILKADGELIPENPEQLKQALAGIISYFPGSDSKDYPRVIVEPIVKTIMNEFQEGLYWETQVNEDKILSIGMPPLSLSRINPAEYNKHKMNYIIAKKHILSRKASNFYYPSKTSHEPDLLEPNGWINREKFANNALSKMYSPKMAALFNNILNNFNTKHMVFTFYKEKAGVNLMNTLFNMCGVKTAVFSGDLTDKKREKLLREYNSIENINGEKIKVIFVTDAGAEGITLLETGHVHILESDARENKIQQAIGRAVRYKSHSRLRPEDRVVHIWRYWSVSKYPIGTKQLFIYDKSKDDTIRLTNETFKIKETIDEKLYEQGKIRMTTINSFLDILIQNSIENM